MSSLATGAIIFACLFTGLFVGMLLARVLPQHHLDKDSKEMVKLGTGLIGTLGALVLGLMVSAAKGSYDTQETELTQMSAKVVMLDRLLSHYGPDSRAAREQLRLAVSDAIKRIWPANNPLKAQLEPTARNEKFYDTLRQLSPQSAAQRAIQQQALTETVELAKTRWLLYEQRGSSISTPFLVVVTFWLSVIFASFGLISPRNGTVVATLLLSALSVTGAMLLILELDRPFDGLIRISSQPLQSALAHLGR